MDIWGGYEEGLVVTVSEADMVRWTLWSRRRRRPRYLRKQMHRTAHRKSTTLLYEHWSDISLLALDVSNRLFAEIYFNQANKYNYVEFGRRVWQECKESSSLAGKKKKEKRKKLGQSEQQEEERNWCCFAPSMFEFITGGKWCIVNLWHLRKKGMGWVVNKVRQLNSYPALRFIRWFPLVFSLLSHY